MHVTEAMKARFSARGFLPTPIDDALLHEIFALAALTPSWSNTQPWTVHVVTGKKLEALRSELVALARSGTPPRTDREWPATYESPYKDRRRENGFALYSKVGVAKDDLAGRVESFARNYNFFGAPAGALMFLRKDLIHYYEIDLGCYLQSLMLLATERGLGACAQAALAIYPDVVRRHLGISDDFDLLCGMSIGYVDEADVYNSFRSGRAPLSETVTFHR